ncbi:MAG: hypothetical protein J6Y17_03020 [Elusimicrobiaceae bacterium]|nr:hypothetical protein [Elusimicrobiaceae bacterium]
MRYLAALLLLVPVFGWGQTTAAEIEVPSAVTAPSSSVDLLKQATQQDSPFAAPASKKPPKVPRPPKPAVSAKPAAASKGATLDMPLTIDGSTTTVQAAVAPAVPKKTAQPRQKAEPEPTVTPAPEPVAEPVENTEEEDAADAELEYAVKMLEKSKQEATAGRAVPPPAAKNKPSKVPSANKAFNPNAFRPGVTWVSSKSNHFDIYTQKAEGGISSPNMAMTFETAYDTLRRFIPWMMSGRVRVFVYQDHNSYLRYEPEAKAWTRAIAYPTRGEIVVYDEPGKTQELKEVFAHELTHIFTQQFFDKHQTGRIMTPTWLDEGLAVLVEDQMFGGKGGPWDRDYRTLRFERDPSTLPADFSSHKMFGGFTPKPFVPVSQRGQKPGPRRGKPVRLEPFEEFMQEGSLETAEGKGRVQNWYLQAYLMVRFLLNPAGGTSPSNRMQFEQFTRLIADGEAVRNPTTGFLVKDARGKQVYEPYSVEKALSKAYYYNNISVFEDNFWKWLSK